MCAWHLVDGVVGAEVGPEALSIVGIIPSAVPLFGPVVHNGNALLVQTGVREKQSANVICLTIRIGEVGCQSTHAHTNTCTHNSPDARRR